MIREIKNLSRQIEDKMLHIAKLRTHNSESQKSASLDTKSIEKKIFTLSKDLEINREKLKIIDRELCESSGQSLDKETFSKKILNGFDLMSQSLFGCDNLLSNVSNKNNIMSQSMNDNLLNDKLEIGHPIEFTSTPKKELTINNTNFISTATTNIGDATETKGCNGTLKKQENKLLFDRSNENVSDPLLKLKYNLIPDIKLVPKKVIDLNLSLENDGFQVDPMDKKTPSQDDLDRITKITHESPLVSLDASEKVNESIREIEKNRQRLLAQQGSNLIEFEKRKMQELKRRSQDEAFRQFNSLPRAVKIHLQLSPQMQKNIKKSETMDSPHHLHERPLSEVNSECSFEGNLSEKSTKLNDNLKEQVLYGGKDEHRNSLQSENSSEGNVIRRNIAKHQRPLTRYMPIFTDLNLRLHIETAGHQINLCPHIFIDQKTCKG